MRVFSSQSDRGRDLSLLLLKYRNLSPFSLPIESGREDKLLCPRSSMVRFTRFPISSESDRRPFSARFNVSKFDNCQIDLGTLPSLLLYRSSDLRFWSSAGWFTLNVLFR